MHIYSVTIDREGTYTNAITMPKRGDGVPMHKHDEETRHDILVTQGSILVYGRGKMWLQKISAGETMSNIPVEHEIVALEDNTIIVNHGLYKTTDGVTVEETGTMDDPITIPLGSR